MIRSRLAIQNNTRHDIVILRAYIERTGVLTWADQNADTDPSTHKQVLAFSNYEFDLEPRKCSSTESIRLHLRHEGFRDQVYSLILPTSSSKGSRHASNALVVEPQTSNFVAIYHPSLCTLTFYSTPDPARWMKAIPDSTNLSDLSIPGTHNSATHHHALISVRCQAVSPLEQLNNGIRFLDIRLQCPSDISSNSSSPTTSGKDFTLVHGSFPVSMTGPKYFRPLLDTIRTWLSQHPSETVIMSIKREGTGAGTDQQLSTRLYDGYFDPTWWYTSPHIPTLSDARGRLVLLRRFFNSDATKAAHHARYGSGRGDNFGLDANGYAFNCANSVVGCVAVQDVCEVPDKSALDAKARVVIEHLSRSCTTAVGADICLLPSPMANGEQESNDRRRDRRAAPLYLNFLSASNLFGLGTWPEHVAARVNPAVLEWICGRDLPGSKTTGTHDDGSSDVTGVTAPRGDTLIASGYGIVICDWVGRKGNWDLVRAIVGSNARLFES